MCSDLAVSFSGNSSFSHHYKMAAAASGIRAQWLSVGLQLNLVLNPIAIMMLGKLLNLFGKWG